MYAYTDKKSHCIVQLTEKSLILRFQIEQHRVADTLRLRFGGGFRHCCCLGHGINNWILSRRLVLWIMKMQWRWSSLSFRFDVAVTDVIFDNFVIATLLPPHTLFPLSPSPSLLFSLAYKKYSRVNKHPQLHYQSNIVLLCLKADAGTNNLNSQLHILINIYILIK